MLPRISLLTATLATWQLCCLGRPVQSLTTFANRSFDYVIVGGGTAGLTVASRLTEDPSVTVLVVEAGGFADRLTGNQSDVPGYAYNYNGKSLADTNTLVEWDFATTPQVGVDDAIVHFTRGKVLGGSSILNYMSYAVGTKGTFDEKWVQATGDESWNWENVAPYYKKSGNFTLPDLSKRAANTTPLYDISSYGVGGPLSLSYPNYGEPFSTYVELALEEVGIAPQDGFTSGVLNGSSWLVYTINATTGTRASSEKAFLQPVLGRPNLALLNETLAEKIIWDGQVARGVQISVGNTSYAALASREVILAAGAFQSPQLLLVSGVGPASTLSQHSIELVHDLPGVGQDLNDHIFFGVTYRVNVQTESVLAYGDASEQAIDQFNTDHTGPLSTSGGDYAGYEKLPPEWRATLSPQALHDLAGFPSDWPEVEYITLPAWSGNFSWAGRGAPSDGYEYATIVVGLVAPLSRGFVSISSPSAHVQPVINPNWLTHPTDIEVALAGFKRVRQLWATAALQSITIGQEALPGLNVTTDEQILDFIKVAFDTISHPTSTCRMGRPDDPLAVLDSRGRVYGVENVRVVDASTFPVLPPGFPQSTVYMVAEKMADYIKNGE